MEQQQDPSTSPKKHIWQKEFNWKCKFSRRQMLNVFGDTKVSMMSSLRQARETETRGHVYTFRLEREVGKDDQSIRSKSTLSFFLGKKMLSSITLKSGMPLKANHLIPCEPNDDLKAMADKLTVNITTKFTKSKFDVPPPIAMSEFASPLLEKKALCDVVIVCGEETFHCHKVILAGRSEVFEAMLTGHFKEAKQERIEIKALEPHIVAKMIKFIYEDCVEKEDVSWDLFEAAKMYGISRLRLLCLKRLGEMLNVENCCKMLEAAFFYDLEETFSTTMKFFKKNKDAVVQTSDWKNLTTNSDLVAKMIMNK